MIDYGAVYNEMYRRGYKRDPEASMGHMLCDWLLTDDYAFDSILDVGCGNGALVGRLIQAGKKAVGLEVSEEAVRRCLDRQRPCVQGSADALPFADDEFDVVISTDVLEHLTVVDAVKAMCEFKRVAKQLVAFTVATVPSGPKDKYIDLASFGIDNLHLTVRSAKWWRTLFEDEEWQARLVFKKGRLTDQRGKIYNAASHPIFVFGRRS